MLLLLCVCPVNCRLPVWLPQDMGHLLLLVCSRAILVCLLTPEGRLQVGRSAACSAPALLGAENLVVDPARL